MSSSNITKCPVDTNDINKLISTIYPILKDNDIHGLGLLGYTQEYKNVQYNKFTTVSAHCENKDPDNPCSVDYDIPKCKGESHETGIYSLFSGTLTTYPEWKHTDIDAEYSCNVGSVEYGNNLAVCKSTGGDHNDPQFPRDACYPGNNNNIVDPTWVDEGSKQLKNVWCGVNPELDKNCAVFNGNPPGLQVCCKGEYDANDSKFETYQALKRFINENYESSNNNYNYNYFDINSINSYKDNITSTRNIQYALVLPKLVYENNDYYLYFPMLISNMNISLNDNDINKDYLNRMNKYITNFLGDPNITLDKIFTYLEPYENSDTDFCCCSQNCTPKPKPNSQNDTLDCSQDCDQKKYICVEWMEMPKTYWPSKELINTFDVPIINNKVLQTITKKIMKEYYTDLNTILNTIEYITINTTNNTVTFSLWGGNINNQNTRPTDSKLYVPKFAKDYIDSLQPKYSDYTFEYIPVGSEYGPSLSDNSGPLSDNSKISTVNEAEIMAMKYNLTIYDKYDSDHKNKLSRTQSVKGKEYFYGAVNTRGDTSGKGTKVGKQYNVSDNAQKTPNFLLGSSPYYIFMHNNTIYNNECEGISMNSKNHINSYNTKKYTAGQLRQNFDVIGKWYKFRVKQWSPTLYIMAAKIHKGPFDETFLEKVKSDTKMMPMQLFYNQCTNNNNWKANKCTEIANSSCAGINLGIDETSYKLPGINYIFDDYFLVSTSNNDESDGVCLCLASNLLPLFIHNKFSDNKFTKAAYCFSSNCDGSQLPKTKISDDECKSYCDIVYDWLTDPDPGKRSKLPQELNSSKFTNLCGKYKPPGSTSYNKIILFVGIILIAVTLIVLLRIFRNKSTRFKLELDITTGVILVALLIFLALDLSGVSSCNGNNIECRSKITNIKIPKFLCPVLQGCECKDGISATCPNPNQQCIQGVCSDINYPNIKDGQIVLHIGENFVKNTSYQTPDKKYTLEYGETFGIYYGNKQTTDKKYKWSINKYANVMFQPTSSSFENSILKINCTIKPIIPKLFELSSKKVTPNLLNKTCAENNPDYTNFIPADPQDVQDAITKYGSEIDVVEQDAWWAGDCVTYKNGKSCFDMFKPPVKPCKCGSYSNGVYSDCGFDNRTGGNMEYDVWCTYDCPTNNEDCGKAKYVTYSMPNWNNYNGQYGYVQKNKDPIALGIAQYPDTSYEQNVMCYNNSPIYEGDDKNYTWDLNKEIDSSVTNILNTFLVFTNDGHLAGYKLDGTKVWTTGPNNSILSV